LRNIASIHWWWTASKAPLIFSYSSDATPPLLRASVAASTTILTARFVDLFLLFSICPSGNKCLASAILVIRCANAISIIFSTVFSNEIERHASGVDFYPKVLLGFSNIVILAILNLRGK
jgi:hypothetical protein